MGFRNTPGDVDAQWRSVSSRIGFDGGQCGSCDFDIFVACARAYANAARQFAAETDWLPAFEQGHAAL